MYNILHKGGFMQNIEIIINKIIRSMPSDGIKFNIENAKEELKNQLKIIGVDIEDLIEWNSFIICKNNDYHTLKFVLKNGNRKIEIYFKDNYHVNYHDEFKEIKSEFCLDENDKLFSRNIVFLLHLDKDYLLNIKNDYNFYGKTFNAGNQSSVMSVVIRCFDERVALNSYNDEKRSIYQNIEFVLPSNYLIDDLIKLIRLYEKNAKIAIECIEECLNNKNISNEIRYISYNDLNFKPIDGKYYLDIKTLPISIATKYGGKVYEIDENDFLYFDNLSIIDYEQLNSWRKTKKRNK